MMSCVKPRLNRSRRSMLRREEGCIMKTLTYDDFDETSLHTSTPFAEQPSDFLEVDFPSPSPVPSPRPRRRITRPRRMSPVAVTLSFEDMEDDEQQVPGECDFSPKSISPPHRRLRALRLFDTPHTPKSLLQKAQKQKIKESRKKSPSTEKVEANVNPFTPGNRQSVGTKRNRSDFERSLLDESMSDETEDVVDMPSNKKIALHEINTSRYNEEFYEVCKLGDGEFGSVHKCVHRLDGCTYAIKKSKTPVAGSVYERNAMNEVYAHAVLGKHAHVVRYYSAWAEDDHMFIQNEYCNGGSLADIIEDNRRSGGHLMESELRQILYQSSQGLKYIHSQNLVHLDIKPGNIFIHRNPKFLASPESGMESCEEDEEREEAVTYKIGDLGHVTSVSNPVVEDGDCRYLSRQILKEDFSHLSKADVFSLGLTIFEAAACKELPKNGDVWHSIRDGHLPSLPQYSAEFHSLLQSMVCPDPRDRPSAQSLTVHPLLCPQIQMTKAQLRKELNEERFKNQLLSMKLIEATQFMTQVSPLAVPVVASANRVLPRSSRLIGNKMKRSMSLSAF
ncbi:wee1-like protein kinase 1-B [Haliotis cracherodii]|uniref:wee1-like protein kinase 1-B n=1 Tax=Haliotis rufescens TaxID=6454 RepID=UPI001EAFF3E9|nr:wee1-like protein kinase 1-B [Haliotis rufescens]